jgi:hypothetical protein
MFRAVLTDKASQSVNRPQPLITGRNRAVSLLFQMDEKPADDDRGEIVNAESVDGFFRLPAGKREEQGQRVAIAQLRIARQIPFQHQVLKQKPTHPRP